MIPAVIERCAGIDVGKTFVVVCVMIGPANGEAQAEIRKFGTMNSSLEQLREWLEECGCTHVVMESTGAYWKPILHVLEKSPKLHIVLANSQQVKGLRGHKTDPCDSQWLAHLLRHGMIRASYIPPLAIRELRALTRRRKQLVRAGAQERNRVQKELEESNIKLGNVLSDVFGLSGQLMLEALVEGKANPEQIAQLAQRQARKKIPQLQAALEGHRLGMVQRELIQLSLQHMAVLEEHIERLDESIFRHIQAAGLQTEHDLLQTIPGVKRQAAAAILAELGPDMTVFGTAPKCSSWSGVCPGNNESAGKKKRAPVMRGNPWLRSTLVECAWAGANKKDSVLQHRYQRLCPRLGHKRAIVAVAHALVLTVFDVLSHHRPFEGVGADPLPPPKLQRLVRHHTRRLRTLKRWLPAAMRTNPPEASPPAAP